MVLAVPGFFANGKPPKYPAWDNFRHHIDMASPMSISLFDWSTTPVQCIKKILVSWVNYSIWRPTVRICISWIKTMSMLINMSDTGRHRQQGRCQNTQRLHFSSICQETSRIYKPAWPRGQRAFISFEPGGLQIQSLKLWRMKRRKSRGK